MLFKLGLLGIVWSAVHGQKGSCPPLLPVSVCETRCSSETSCAEPQLCCPTSCGGSLCVDPVTQRRFINLVKPGSCPAKPGGVWVCSHTCSSDSDCPRRLKCCANRCGALVCTKAEFQSTTTKPVEPNTLPQFPTNPPVISNQPVDPNNEGNTYNNTPGNPKNKPVIPINEMVNVNKESLDANIETLHSRAMNTHSESVVPNSAPMNPINDPVSMNNEPVNMNNDSSNISHDNSDNNKPKAIDNEYENSNNNLNYIENHPVYIPSDQPIETPNNPMRINKGSENIDPVENYVRRSEPRHLEFYPTIDSVNLEHKESDDVRPEYNPSYSRISKNSHIETSPDN